MFSSRQVRQWQAAVGSTPGLRHAYEGHHLDSAHIDLGSAPDPSLGEAPAALGTFTPPSRIFGTPFDAACLADVRLTELSARPPTCVHHAGARIVGFAAVLTRDARLLVPHDVRLIGRQAFLRRPDSAAQGFLFDEQPDGLEIHFAARAAPRHIPMRAVFFHHLEGGNFGSFMFRQLPQMLAARDICAASDCIVTPGRPPWFREALALLGMADKPVFTVAEICGDVFDTVTLLDGYDHEGFVRRQTRAALADLLRAVVPEGHEGPARIYVSRSLSALARPAYRPMLNEPAVEDIMRERGFAILHPETLTLAGQMKALSRARVIVGPSGSGMFNTMFAPPGARVIDIETHTVSVRQHAKLYASLGHDYAFVFAPPLPDDRPPSLRKWELPLDRLDEALAWALVFGEGKARGSAPGPR